MDIFIKSASCVIVTTILALVLSKTGKDVSLLLILMVCSMVAIAATHYLQPIIAFLERLRSLGNIDNEMLTMVLRAVGIGLITEFVNLICVDSGNAALGKTLQYMGTIVILWLSIPLFDSILSLVEEIIRSV